MSTINEKMTALADEVRELSGVTTPLSIDNMTTEVSGANAKVIEESNLIAQIKNVVDSLPEAGGGTIAAEIYTVRNNLSCDICIGGTCIASGTSMQFPITDGTLVPILCAVKSGDKTLNAYLNGIVATFCMYAKAFKKNDQVMDFEDTYLQGARAWMIVFTSQSTLINGDIIDIGDAV